jgi:hypothetical protein
MTATFRYLHLKGIVVTHAARSLLQHFGEDAVARSVDGQQAVVAAIIENFSLKVGLPNAAADIWIAYAAIAIATKVATLAGSGWLPLISLRTWTAWLPT